MLKLLKLCILYCEMFDRCCSPKFTESAVSTQRPWQIELRILGKPNPQPRQVIQYPRQAESATLASWIYGLDGLEFTESAVLTQLPWQVGFSVFGKLIFTVLTNEELATDTDHALYFATLWNCYSH